MTEKDAIEYCLESTKSMIHMYLNDLSDADILVRPVPSANHVAWQLGHLISSEIQLMKAELPGLHYPELPAGFAEKHNKAASTSDTGFLTKDQYLALFDKVRASTLAILRILPEDELNKPSEGPLASLAPTIGTLMLTLGNHTLMHAGQFTVIRRALGKPVLF